MRKYLLRWLIQQNRTLSQLLALVVSGWFGGLVARAQFSGGGFGGGNTLPGSTVTDATSFREQIICTIAAYMFWILLAIVIVFVLVAAWKYLTSSGDSEKVHSATMTLTYAALAMVVAILARAFPLIVASVFGNTLTGFTLSSTTICP